MSKRDTDDYHFSKRYTWALQYRWYRLRMTEVIHCLSENSRIPALKLDMFRTNSYKGLPPAAFSRSYIIYIISRFIAYYVTNRVFARGYIPSCILGLCSFADTLVPTISYKVTLNKQTSVSTRDTDDFIHMRTLPPWSLSVGECLAICLPIY